MTGTGEETPAGLAAALLELDRVVRRLRRECPWDREQEISDVVTHTLEETYELIDAAHAGRGDEVAGEVGDLLFHSFFLSLLAEEKGWGDLSGIATDITAKLVRRHPHVFGEGAAATAAEVVDRWEEIKKEQEGRQGIFHDIPENFPAPLYARRLQGRAASVGFDFKSPEPVFGKIEEEVAELRGALAAEPELPASGQRGAETAVYHEVGDLLFAAVNLARKLDVDPELALRSAARRFRTRVEEAEAGAAAAGEDFSTLPLQRQEEYYQRAKGN